MAFGLLMKDNTPVDYPFRRSGSAAEESVSLGYVPGGPYYPRSMPNMRYAGYGAGTLWDAQNVRAVRNAQLQPVVSADSFGPGEWSLLARAMQKHGLIGSAFTRSQLMTAFSRWAFMNGFTEQRFGTKWDDYAYEALVKKSGFAGYGYVPGGPYYPRSMPNMRYAGFGAYGSTGCGDDGMSPCEDIPPGPQAQTQSEGTSWSKLGTGIANLTTSFVNAFAQPNQPAAGGAGSYCPSGYYLNAGRCVPIPASSGMSMTPLLIGGGLLAAVLLMKKRSA